MKLIVCLFALTTFKSYSQQKFIAYTKENTIYKFNQSAFIILKNNKTCASCFTELSSYLKKNIASKEYNLNCLSLVDSSVFAKKIESIRIAELMPEIETILFSYKTSDASNSPFSFYNVEYTPALLVLKNKNIYYYSYDDIFSNGIEKFFLVHKF